LKVKILLSPNHQYLLAIGLRGLTDAGVHVLDPLILTREALVRQFRNALDGAEQGEHGLLLVSQLSFG